MITITYMYTVHYSLQQLILYILSISIYYTFSGAGFVDARTTLHSQTFTQTDNNKYNNNIHIDYNIPFKSPTHFFIIYSEGN